MLDQYQPSQTEDGAETNEQILKIEEKLSDLTREDLFSRRVSDGVKTTVKFGTVAEGGVEIKDGKAVFEVPLRYEITESDGDDTDLDDQMNLVCEQDLSDGIVRVVGKKNADGEPYRGGKLAVWSDEAEERIQEILSK